MIESFKLRFIKNVGWFFGVEVILKFLVYGVIVILSRIFGLEGFG